MKLKIFKDGVRWCILLGKNLQEGKAVFGKTLFEAFSEFYYYMLSRKFNKKNNPGDPGLKN